MGERRYSFTEIEDMRGFVRTACFPTSGTYYNPQERNAAIELHLQTFMQNGTEPNELKDAATKRLNASFEARERDREFQKEMQAKAPPPRVLVSKDDVIDEWFQTCVAKYEGASVTAKELFDGFGGRTLMSFANQNALDGMYISQRNMERYLEAKGVRSRTAMCAKRYDGIRHIMFGNVRSGNYGT